MKNQRETPDWLINKMINLLDLRYGNHILEPSCGEGKIINAILDNPAFFTCRFDITGIELNKEKFYANLHVNSKYPHSHVIDIKNMDFLEFAKRVGQWDRIIACPPFKNGIDQLHIAAMYDLLARDGIMVTLTKHSEWMNGITAEPFREWLSHIDHKLILLPDNTFIEKRKSVPTSILIINK